MGLWEQDWRQPVTQPDLCQCPASSGAVLTSRAGSPRGTFPRLLLLLALRGTHSLYLDVLVSYPCVHDWDREFDFTFPFPVRDGISNKIGGASTKGGA